MAVADQKILPTCISVLSAAQQQADQVVDAHQAALVVHAAQGQGHAPGHGAHQAGKVGPYARAIHQGRAHDDQFHSAASRQRL